MKVIRAKDIKDIPAREMKPGMIIAEGFVLGVYTDGDVTFLTTPRVDVVVDYGSTVQVYGRLGPHETAAIQAAYDNGAIR